MSEDKDKIYGGIYGHIIGDILGVPVEFMNRSNIKNYPVRDMCANQMRGTSIGFWSDDSAMTLCTLKSIVDCDGVNNEDMMDNFARWLTDGYLSADGRCFGIGRATMYALSRYIKTGSFTKYMNNNPESEKNGGNGALMRILPLIIYYHAEISKPDSVITRDDAIKKIAQSVIITHNLMINVRACAFFAMLVFNLLDGQAKKEAYANAVSEYHIHYGDSRSDDMKRIIATDLSELAELELKTTGYVVYTLEVALLCFLNSESYEETVLRAVNLLGDTDTNAAIAGSMAGIYYGYSSISEEWISKIMKKDMIDEIVDDFYKSIS